MFSSRNALFGIIQSFRKTISIPVIENPVLCPYIIDTDGLAIFGTDPIDSISTVSGVTTITMNQTTNAVADNRAGTALTSTDNTHLASSLGSPGVFSFGESIPLSATGIVAWEAEVDVSNLVVSNIGTFLPAITLQFTMGTINGQTFAQVVGQAQLKLRYNDDTGEMQFDCQYAAQDTGAGQSSVATVGGSATPSAGIERVGLYYNLATGQVGITNSLDGDLGYLPNFTTGDFTGQNITDHLPPESAGMVNIQAEAYYSADATTGFVSASTFQNASDYQLSYPSGATDPCGNEIIPAVFCVYPLDAAEATIQAAGYQGKLVPSESDTKGSRLIVDGVQSTGTQIMANAGVFVGDPGAFYDFSTGKKAIEFEMFVGAFTPEDGLAGGLLTQVSAGLTTGLANPLYIFYNLLEDSDRVTGIGSSRGTEWSSGVQAPSTDVARIGILVDSVASEVRAWVNGVEVTLTDSSLPSGLAGVAPYLAIEHVGADDNGAVGITQYAKVYTTASDFTTPFPAGTTDPCGNLVS